MTDIGLTYDFRGVISQRIRVHHVLGAKNPHQLIEKLALLLLSPENRREFLNLLEKNIL